MIYRRIAGAVAVLATAGLGAFALAGPAGAAELSPAAPWQALDTGTPTGVWAPDAAQVSSSLSTVVDPTTVRLEWAAGSVASNLGTSVETDNLGIEVEAGAEVSFHYVLSDGAECTLGAPRVFGYFDGGTSVAGLRPATAPDFKSQGCGTPDGEGHTVTATVGAAGTIGYAGVTYDALKPGVVTISNLTVDGELVLFAARSEPCEFDADLTADDPECLPPASPSPTAGPVTEPGEEPGGVAGGKLPTTGGDLPLFLVAAFGLAGLGVGALALARFRRPTVPTEGAE